MRLFEPGSRPSGAQPEILFSDLALSPRSLSVTVHVSEAEPFELWFRWNTDMELHGDQIATAFSTFCLSKYRLINFDFAVSDHAASRIANYSLSSVVAGQQGEEWSLRPRSGTALSFSGGFDSLAAKFLLPDDADLVSMDFGGRFSLQISGGVRLHEVSAFIVAAGSRGLRTA